MNPVLARESRVRMRGWRAPALISLYVGLMGLAVTAILLVASYNRGNTFAPEMGSVIYSVLVVVQFVLLIFSAPGLTAGAISGEREKQTLDLLLLTRMTPLQVVTGKLGAAVSFSLLLMVASLPVYSILFLLGGVSLSRLAMTVAVYVVTVLLLGAIGVYYSALFKRTQAAVVAAYGTAVALMAFPLIASVLIFEVFNRPPDVPPAWTVIFGIVNPIMGLVAAAGGMLGQITSLYGRVLETPAAREALWWQYCLAGLVMAAVLVWMTARKIRPMKDK
jgi:ABC-type transport system involved in multi-copper enzyme maturation permease subunit